MLGVKIAIVCFMAMADMSGGKPTAVNVPEPTTAVVVEATTTQAPPQTEAPTQAVPEPPKAEGFVVYRIHGTVPPVEWQRYLYDELSRLGYAWYMPFAVCQIQQESCWSQWSDNGRDFGLTQQKGIYWADRAAYYGIPGADIWDPYAQLHVYANQMAGYLAANGGAVEWALSEYINGAHGAYHDAYVTAVLSHWNALEEVR